MIPVKTRECRPCGKFQSSSPPSQLPLAMFDSESGCFANTSTASTCPSKAPIKGLANILSIFAAFKALVLSRAREKGCILGSRLRETGVGSPGRRGR